MYINISTRVPQASILGPLFSIIPMNDFPNVNRLFKCIIYADNTILIANLNNSYAKYDSELNNSLLNDELGKINKVSQDQLKNFMLFYEPQKRVTIPKLQLSGTSIGCVDEFNYLGLI